MNRTRIKVCGMTREADVRAAVAVGADAIGMILHADSPRLISLSVAKALRDSVPPFISVVGVFVDAEASLIEHYCNELHLDTVQLHGSESPEFAASLTRPYIKALRVQSRQQVVQADQDYLTATGLLLDPYVLGKHGGTGTLLDQDLWPKTGVVKSLILAGGLNPDNIRQRVEALEPMAVDVNSGVESEPGKKEHPLLSRLVEEVRLADQARVMNSAS